MMGTIQPSDVAVVILNWNGRHHLETYLPSVLEHTPSDTHVWIVDNGSTDDSVAWLRAHHSPQVQLVELDQNLGFAAGYNEGLKQIDAEVYVLLNSDVRMDGPGWNPCWRRWTNTVGMQRVRSWFRMFGRACANMQALQEDGWTRTATPFVWDGCLKAWNRWTRGWPKTVRCSGLPAPAFSFERRLGCTPRASTARCLPTWRKLTCAGG